MIDCPVNWQDLITCQRDLRAAGSTPVVGSSNRTRLGLPIKAIAIFRRRLFPPLYALLGWEAQRVKSKIKR